MNSNITATGLGSYGPYTQDHGYETDNGVVALPVAGRTPKFRLIRLHGGIGLRRVQWQAKRAGKPPIIPSPVDVGTDTLLTHTIRVATAPNQQQNGYDWDIRGEYLYIEGTPRIAGTDTLPTGGVPYPLATIDPAATDLTNTFFSAFDNAGPDENPFDVLMKAISTTVDHDRNLYVWPFTSLPPKFTNDNLFNQ